MGPVLTAPYAQTRPILREHIDHVDLLSRHAGGSATDKKMQHKLGNFEILIIEIMTREGLPHTTTKRPVEEELRWLHQISIEQC